MLVYIQKCRASFPAFSLLVSFWASICILSLFVSCTPKEEPTALNVKNKEFSFSDTGGKQTLSFVVNKSWKINCPDSWCTVSQTSGNVSNSDVVSLEVSCKPNDTFSERESTITVICAELSEFVTIKQAANYTLEVSQTSFDVPSSGQIIEITVKNNDDSSISVSVSDSWIKSVGTKAITENKYVFNVDANTSHNERKGYIHFFDAKNKLEAKVSIVQSQNDAIDIDTKEYNAKPEGDEINIKISHNVDYRVTSSVEWIKQISTKAYVTDYLLLSVESNESGAKRSGVITIESLDNAIKHELTILQEKRIYPVESVSLNETSIEGKVGDEYTLIATIKPENATDKTLTWTSSNDEIVSVDSNGKIALNQIGECIITVKAGEFSANCSVKITGYKNSVDLSSSGTANCYIASAPGVYRFKATKGNSDSAVQGSTAEVLWRSFNTKTKPESNEVIVGPILNDGYVYFATSKEFMEGNAVVAVKDSNGNIIWSWHIWVTTADLEALKQTYANNAGIMMDRNLGALSAKPGDPLSFGLLYEWGRKDPFTGCATYDSTNPIATDAQWPSAIMTRAIIQQNQTALEYSISHPMHYIYNSELPYDWQALSQDECDHYLWKSQKTIYDPCPPGWRVPDGGDNGIWKKAGIPESSLYNTVTKGIRISSPYCTPDAWYPSIGGGRQWNGGGINHVGEWGNYWSCTYMYESWMDTYPPTWNNYYDFDFYASETRAKSHSYSGQGQAVRCCKE